VRIKLIKGIFDNERFKKLEAVSARKKTSLTKLSVYDEVLCRLLEGTIFCHEQLFMISDVSLAK
jgi:hypothetical protein